MGGSSMAEMAARLTSGCASVIIKQISNPLSTHHYWILSRAHEKNYEFYDLSCVFLRKGKEKITTSGFWAIFTGFWIYPRFSSTSLARRKLRNISNPEKIAHKAVLQNFRLNITTERNRIKNQFWEDLYCVPADNFKIERRTFAISLLIDNDKACLILGGNFNPLKIRMTVKIMKVEFCHDFWQKSQELPLSHVERQFACAIYFKVLAEMKSLFIIAWEIYFMQRQKS